MREISGTATRKEIIEIQDRYARLVLNVPVKTIRKIKESPPPPKTARKKGELEEPGPDPELLKTGLDEAPSLQEKVEEKEVEIVIKREIPEIKIKSPVQYEIKLDAVQIEDEGGGELALVVPADIPDPRSGYSGKYGTKARSGPAMEAPDIDVRPAKRYDVGERGGPDIAPVSPVAGSLTRRYDLPEGRGASKIQAVDVQRLQRPAVITASNVPDTRGEASKRYVMARRGRGSNVPSQGGSATSGKGISPDIPLTDRQVSRERVVSTEQVAPDVQTRVSRRYSGGREEDISKTSRSSYPEQSVKKEDTISGGEKSGYYLPETAALRHLAACVDPREEIQLKRQVLAYIDGDTLYCEDSLARYAFLNTEMLTTLDVRFATYREGEYNRCDALRMALKCLYNKKPKR